MSEPTAQRYTSVAEVTATVAPAGDTAGTAAELDEQQLVDEVAQAEDRIDAELAGRYAVHMPFAPVPAVVKRIARDIAVYNAELTYRGAARITFGDFDPVIMRYRAAVDLLDRLARGVAELAVPAIDATTSAGGLAGTPRRPRGRLFTEGDLLAPTSRRAAPVDEPWWEW